MRFLPDIPVGMSIWAGDEPVVGIQHVLASAVLFAGGNNHDILLVQEPNNEYDKNAIKVLGVYTDSTGRLCSAHIGYVAASTAKAIARRGDIASLRIRSKNIWWGSFEKNFIVVEFDIFQPKPPPNERKSKTTKLR